jgi:hypothetical protein
MIYFTIDMDIHPMMYFVRYQSILKDLHKTSLFRRSFLFVEVVQIVNEKFGPELWFGLKFYELDALSGSTFTYLMNWTYGSVQGPPNCRIQ